MEYNTASFDDWKTGVAEVNFLDPEDRQTTDIEELLVGAWNFCALQEAKEEELYNDGYDE